MEIRVFLLIQTNTLREGDRCNCYKSERLISMSDERFAIIDGDDIMVKLVKY